MSKKELPEMQIQIDRPIENYTKTPNCILDNLQYFKGAKLSVLMLMIRETIGYHNFGDKNFSVRYIVKHTGYQNEAVQKALSELEKLGSIENTGEDSKGKKYKVSWKKPTQSLTGVPEIDTHLRVSGVPKIGTEVYRKSVQAVPEIGTEVYRKSVQNKERKETIKEKKERKTSLSSESLVEKFPEKEKTPELDPKPEAPEKKEGSFSLSQFFLKIKEVTEKAGLDYTPKSSREVTAFNELSGNIGGLTRTPEEIMDLYCFFCSLKADRKYEKEFWYNQPTNLSSLNSYISHIAQIRKKATQGQKSPSPTPNLPPAQKARENGNGAELKGIQGEVVESFPTTGKKSPEWAEFLEYCKGKIAPASYEILQSLKPEKDKAGEMKIPTTGKKILDEYVRKYFGIKGAA